MLADVVAREAARMLAFADGERRITHLLQLGEQLQEARARRLGPQGQLDWLRAAIAHADREDEAQWPNLESDASRVQILTLHKSKGLEFPFVFLPFAAIGRDSRNGNLCEYHDGATRVLQIRSDASPGDSAAWSNAKAQQEREERGEDARLLYVGLTRAQHALWLATGPFAQAELSPLARMLDDPGELEARLGDAIDLQRPTLPLTLPRPLPPEHSEVVPV